MTAYVVRPEDPDRAARAVIQRQFLRPGTLTLFVVIVVLGAFSGSVGGILGAAIGALVAALLILVLLTIKRQQMRHELAARGLRPGSALTVEARESGFEVRAATASATHAYTEVRDVRDRDGIITMRIPPARFVVVLPSAAVPHEVRAALFGRSAGAP